MKRAYVLYEKLLTVGLILSGILIFFMTVTVSADVILRNLNWTNLPWVVEVSEYILFIATFLAAPWVMHKDGHTRVDLLTRMLPVRAGTVTRTIADCVALSVCLFLLYYGARVALEAFRLNTQIFKQLVVPEWWLYSVIPVTGILLTTEFLIRIMGRFGRGPMAQKAGNQTRGEI
jgi:TRAP-type C4-dicarboxylate transport system permease small subunit